MGTAGESVSSFARMRKRLTEFLAALGSPAVAYLAAGWLAEQFELSPTTRIVIFVILTVALICVFLLGWLLTWLWDVFTGKALPGFSGNADETLLNVAREYFPRIRLRRRSKVALALGLGIIRAKLNRVRFSLGYFAEARFGVLINELDREEDFDEPHLKHLSHVAWSLHRDFVKFQKLGAVVMAFAAKLDSRPGFIDRGAIEYVAEQLHIIADELSSLANRAGTAGGAGSAKCRCVQLTDTFRELGERLKTLIDPIAELENDCQTTLLEPLLPAGT